MKFPFASILALAAAQMTQVDAVDDANSIRGIRSSGVDYAAAGVGRKLKAAKALVGPELLHVHSSMNVLSLKRPGMRLDLGGIGMGIAADRAVDVLKCRETLFVSCHVVLKLFAFG